MTFATTFFWLIAILLMVSCCRFQSSKLQLLFAIVFYALGFIPLGPLTLMQHWQSFVGHLSVLSFFWFASKLTPRVVATTMSDKIALVALSVVLILFYTLALGFTSWDPYRWGFGDSHLVVVAMMVLGILLSYQKRWRASYAIMAALLAYALDLLPTNNIWDYFVDPILLIAVIGATINSHLFNRNTRNATPINRPA